MNSEMSLVDPVRAAATLPQPRRVPFDAPWAWLAAGWRDMWNTPSVSLTYGAVFALVAAGLIGVLASVGAQSMFLVLASGFLLVGPLFAVGLYDASRRVAQQEEPRLAHVVMAGLKARGQLAFFGAVLLFVFLVWVQIAFLLLMLFFDQSGLPPTDQFMQTLLFTSRGLAFLIVGSLVGGVLAAIVYAISVVAVPLLLSQPTDAISAARASVDAVIANPKPMALWAGLIVVIMAAGFTSLLVGLVLAFPLVAHATWHAYQEIYGPATAPT